LDTTEVIGQLLGEIPDVPRVLIVVGLLAGPTALWIAYRMYRMSGRRRQRADREDVFWICERCRSANDFARMACYSCGLEQADHGDSMLIVDRGQVVSLDPEPEPEPERPPAPMPVPVMAPIEARAPVGTSQALSVGPVTSSGSPAPDPVDATITPLAVALAEAEAAARPRRARLLPRRVRTAPGDPAVIDLEPSAARIAARVAELHRARSGEREPVDTGTTPTEPGVVAPRRIVVASTDGRPD
jgi:hypothetical protein